MAWQSYLGGEVAVKQVEGLLGVVVERERPLTSIISIDLCEVVRRTHEAVTLAMDRDLSWLGNRVWEYNFPELSEQEVADLVTVLMNHTDILPVEGIDEIGATLRAIRSEEPDILIVANTSTLPGCERVTIDFLRRHLPDCFDGILFPSSKHVGSKLTKADALRSLLVSINGGQPCARLVHIDDAPYHAASIIGAMPRLANDGLCIVPLYEAGANAIADDIGNDLPPEAHIVQGPIAAFAATRDYLMATRGAAEGL